jgi:glyoxylase-like metal-dependent hydrolase (beta-lactamase superfamily II)
MVADPWFAVRALEPGIHLIAEPPHVSSFLVQGERRAVLIDSGLGIGNIRRVVEELTDREVLVVNTHYHFDHAGGNHLFDKIAIHERGVEPLGQPTPDEVSRRYMDYALAILENFRVYRELDERFFHFLSDETTPRPLPPGLDPDRWAVVPSVPSQVLRDGDVLDLGGRSLRVLHTPGHTPDCVCLLDEAHGVLFGGDTINTGPIYSQLPDSDVPAFAASTRRVADEAGGVRMIYMPHFVRYAADAALLPEIAEGFAAVQAGQVTWRPSRDCLGFPVQEALFRRFSIFVAGADAAESPFSGGASGSR